MEVASDDCTEGIIGDREFPNLLRLSFNGDGAESAHPKVFSEPTRGNASDLPKVWGDPIVSDLLEEAPEAAKASIEVTDGADGIETEGDCRTRFDATIDSTWLASDAGRTLRMA